MGKINVNDIMIENQKKIWKSIYLHKLHLIDGLGMEFTAC